MKTSQYTLRLYSTYKIHEAYHNITITVIFNTHHRETLHLTTPCSLQTMISLSWAPWIRCRVKTLFRMLPHILIHLQSDSLCRSIGSQLLDNLVFWIRRLQWSLSHHLVWVSRFDLLQRARRSRWIHTANSLYKLGSCYRQLNTRITWIWYRP